MAHSGELVGSFSRATDAARDFIDEAPQQGITTLPRSTLNVKIKKIEFGRVKDPFRSMILGEEHLQNGTVQLGDVIYQGVSICLPTTDAVDDNGNNDDDDDDDDDDDGDSSDGRKKPAASAPTKSFGSQKKLAAFPWAKKQSAAPKKSDDDNDDNIDDDMKPAAVPKPSSSKMKLDFGVKKLSAPRKDSKSKSCGTKEPTVGKKSSSDATGRIDGCSCGSKSKCLTKACPCYVAGEDCDPKRGCQCNCFTCENKGRKKGDGKGKKQMKLSFFGKQLG